LQCLFKTPITAVKRIRMETDFNHVQPPPVDRPSKLEKARPVNERASSILLIL
jgi:hypothetical protein